MNIVANKLFLKPLLNLLLFFQILHKYNYKVFYVNTPFLKLNVNLLNYSNFSPTVFKNNFFFFFFKFEWVVNEKYQAKLIYFLRLQNVKVFFFFEPLHRSALWLFLGGGLFATSGLVQNKSLNHLYDYPIYVEQPTFVQMYYFYVLFFKFFLEIQNFKTICDLHKLVYLNIN